MLNLGGPHRVFLCVKRVDFRKAHDGLCALVRDEFMDDPFLCGGPRYVTENSLPRGLIRGDPPSSAT